MRRPLAAGFVLLLVSLLLSACNLTPSAAVVDGTDIPQSTLNGFVADLQNSAAVRCAFDIRRGANQLGVSGVGQNTKGGGSPAVSTTVVAAELNILVEDDIFERWLSSHGHPLSAAQVSLVKAAMPSVLNVPQTTGVTPPQDCNGISLGNTLVHKLPAAYLTSETRLLAAQEQVVGRTELEHLVCIGAVFEDTQAAAQTAENEIAGGTSFATVVAKGANTAVGAPANGQFGCGPRWFYEPGLQQFSYPTAWDAAVERVPVNDVSAPIAFPIPQIGVTAYAVVDVLGTSSFDQLSPTVRFDLFSIVNQSYQAERGVATVYQQAHVSIDSGDGRWVGAIVRRNGDVTIPGVCPPQSPPAKDVPKPAADNSPNALVVTACNH